MVRLVWNAIVKNEDARIKRCVDSLMPHIDGAVIVDTGSTDQTLVVLSDLFKAAGKPLEIHHAPFENFSQARNEALRRARESDIGWDYLILADADMELKADKPQWLNGHDELAYDMKQYAGGLGYYNKRLVSRKAQGNYVGVTHEYLEVVGNGVIDGAYFVDHADGANRPDKFKRDIRLLKKALQSETSPGLIQRYHFYLAQSYFDGGQWQKAAEFYKKRVALGGWAEEVWNAQVHYAHALGNMGKWKDFIVEMLYAYEMRPSRGETLYDLARYFRERGYNHSSLLCSRAGMELPRPDDKLFVNEDVYNSGLREEFAICAYYDDKHRRAGAKEANKLALAGSDQARANLYWYMRPLSEHVSSFTPEKIEFTPPDGYVAMNPSVINSGGVPHVLVRTVNYTITEDGQYRIRADDGSISDSHPIHTRNFIGLADGYHELMMPTNWPEVPEFPLVLGFEDSRLFEWRQQFWTLSTVRSLTHEGWCEQVLAPIDREAHCWRYGNNWRQIRPPHRQNEKNWMPWVDGEQLSFVYRLGTLITPEGELVGDKAPWDVGRISGGSQVVKINDGTYLAIVHEADQSPGRPNRYYRHRFVRFNFEKRPVRISPPFYFQDKQIEFAAGIAYFPDKRQLIVSYGVRDCEPWMAAMDLQQVLDFVGED